MNAILRISVLILATIFCAAQAPKTSTNHIEFYLLENEVPREQSIKGEVKLQEMRLKKEPILSDKDFVSWDLKKHSFVIKPEAGKRLLTNCWGRIIPFVLVCDGRRVYVGQFGTSTSSTSAAIPTILLDGLPFELFVDYENIPVSFWREFRFGRTEAVEKSGYKTQNVKLQIDAGYPPPDGFGGKDLRTDKRLEAAVQSLREKLKN